MRQIYVCLKKSAALCQILAEIRNAFCFQFQITLNFYINIKGFVLESIYQIKSSQTITKYFEVYFVFISCNIISTASATINEAKHDIVHIKCLETGTITFLIGTLNRMISNIT